MELIKISKNLRGKPPRGLPPGGEPLSPPSLEFYIKNLQTKGGLKEGPHSRGLLIPSPQDAIALKQKFGPEREKSPRF